MTGPCTTITILIAGLDDPHYRQVLLAHSLVGRTAQPEETTGMVLYLCSDLASFAKGQTFVIDGAVTRRS